MALDYVQAQTVMMQLGAFQFGIATAAYRELSRSTELRWASVDRFGQRPALQFTGPGEETLDLPGVIYPEWRGGFGQLDAMRALAGKGKPMRLVDGTGASLGQWVITKVDEKQSVFAGQGKPRKVEFSLSLKRFQDDGVAALVAAVTSTTTSTSANAIALTLPAASTGAVNQATTLAKSIASNAKALASKAATALAAVQKQAAAIASVVKKVQGAVNRAASVARQLQTAANKILKLVGAKPINIAAISAAQDFAARAARMVIQAESATKLLRSATQAIAGTSGVPGAAIKAVQGCVGVANSVTSLARQSASLAGKVGGA